MASSFPHIIKNLMLTQSHQINWNKNQFDDMNEAAFWNLFGGLPFSLNSIYFQPSLQVIPIFESTIESTDNGCWMLTISPHPTIHLGLSIFTKRWFCIHIQKTQQHTYPQVSHLSSPYFLYSVCRQAKQNMWPQGSLRGSIIYGNLSRQCPQLAKSVKLP